MLTITALYGKLVLQTGRVYKVFIVLAHNELFHIIRDPVVPSSLLGFFLPLFNQCQQ